jgi:hypothetical protein
MRKPRTVRRECEKLQNRRDETESVARKVASPEADDSKGVTIHIATTQNQHCARMRGELQGEPRGADHGRVVTTHGLTVTVSGKSACRIGGQNDIVNDIIYFCQVANDIIFANHQKEARTFLTYHTDMSGARTTTLHASRGPRRVEERS